MIPLKQAICLAYILDVLAHCLPSRSLIPRVAGHDFSIIPDGFSGILASCVCFIRAQVLVCFAAYLYFTLCDDIISLLIGPVFS